MLGPMRVFLFPFGILLLDEDLMIFQGSWIPAGKKVQTTSQPRLSVHHLGGPVSYTITINLYSYTINMRFCLLIFFWGILNSLEIWKLNPSLISSPPFFLCNPLPKTKKTGQEHPVVSVQEQRLWRYLEGKPGEKKNVDVYLGSAEL